jgi:hypothetical protein
MCEAKPLGLCDFGFSDGEVHIFSGGRLCVNCKQFLLNQKEEICRQNWAHTIIFIYIRCRVSM